MYKLVTEYLKLVGIATMVTLLWQGLELMILGKINPNTVDNIICMILSYSLYLNLSNCENKGGVK